MDGRPNSRKKAAFLKFSRVVWTGDDVTYNTVVTGMDTPKYGETLKFVYIRYQPILAKSYPKVYQVYIELSNFF